MNAKLLLDDLRGRGVKIETDGERLLVDAPAGVITEDLRDALIKKQDGAPEAPRARAAQA